MNKTIDFSNLYWYELINERFIPLMDDKSRYLILYGGRGSSKSDFAAKKLIYRCLSEKYFKCILVRNTFKDIKGSQYDLIKRIINEWGLEEYFTFCLNPLEIRCKNGNIFLARGCDDTTKIKSTDNPSAIWFEEDIPSYEDFQKITTTVRSNTATYLQEIFTINPEIKGGGDYKEHWFYKQFFTKDEKTFNDFAEVDYDGKLIKIEWSVHHSTFLDNKWLTDESKAKLISYQDNDPYYYTIYTLGQWGNVSPDGLFYKKFNRNKNTTDIGYDPNLGLHISFDFNTQPYMSLSIWQIRDKMIYCIDEIATKDPFNNTRDMCRLFKNKYSMHASGLFIYGDPAGKHEDTRSEKGFNDYKIIEQELVLYRPTFRIASKHPPVAMRGQFINSIFSEYFNGLHIEINIDCHHMLADLMNGREKPDGTKLKEKVNGYEKYHHFSDNFDYFICEAFKSDFNLYQRGPTPVQPIWFEHTASPKHRL